jgi:fructose-1,6-bisphosphatase/inositol monophosphatase family enzyme
MIRNMVALDPERALDPVPRPHKDPHNQPIWIDEFAEGWFAQELNQTFRGKIKPIGEESLEKYPELRNLSNFQQVVAIMDIVDGSDLLLRGLSNWCSAVVFFDPPKKKILVAAVADHDGNIFFASELGDHSLFQRRNSDSPVPLHISTRPEKLYNATINFIRHKPSGPLETLSMSEAALCFYGQKPPNFLSVYTGQFRETMEHLAKSLKSGKRPAPALRIYNLGGIPMMLKVANGTMDAVFDLTGPKPHDVVPGAYIALKAGAFLGDTQGNPITETNLAESLLRPAEKGPPYILAATSDLYKDLQTRLSS